MSEVFFLAEWRLSDESDGRLSLVGILVGHPQQGPVVNFHTAPVVKFLAPAVVLTANGAVYRLLPRTNPERFPPGFLSQVAPKSWLGVRGGSAGKNVPLPGENHS
jgi:hypothetical protein